MTEDLPRGQPTLRTVPRPGDINALGNIFGGWVLSQMDIAGGIVAHKAAGGSVATVAIESMVFVKPIHLHDVVSVYARVEGRGRTSLRVAIDVVAARYRGGEEVLVTTGLFTFVAVDADGRPRPLPEE